MHSKMLPTAMIRRAMAAAAGASALLMAGAAQATLQDRDLDGNNVVDAFYDTELDITWLRNANVNGTMNWGNAVAWADGLNFAGYDDWRLPTSNSCVGNNCSGSEMGHLWYVELGNPAGGPMTNTGNFLNMQQSSVYWSGTQSESNTAYAWFFNFRYGSQDSGSKTSPLYAMAVRPGDVAAVPEPAAYGLALAALGVLAVARRQRSH